jgi:DNA-binding GntR family transcriptional regulator
VVRQAALASSLIISKIALREAMARLQLDGLLTSHPNKGFFVPPLTAGEAEEVFELRLQIEPAAAARGALMASANDQRLAREAAAAWEAQEDPAAPSAIDLNRAFHLALVRPQDRLITTQLIERLHILAERYVRVHLEPTERRVRASGEHGALLRAWLRRDVARVATLAEAHIAATLEDLRVQLAAG